MTWFLVDDGLNTHPKARIAGLAAMGLWTVAGSYCSRHLTDGFVPDWYVQSWPSGKKLAARLITAELWTESERDGVQGWQFHQWTEFQHSKQKVEEKRAENRKRKADWRERKAREESGHAVTDSVTDVVTDSVRHSGSHSGSHNRLSSPILPYPITTTTEVSSSGYEVNATADDSRGPVVDVSMVKLAKAYTDKVKLTNPGRVAAVCLNAVGAGYTQDQIRAGLTVLADEQRTVTADTLRIAMQGEAPKARGRPSESTGTTRSRAALDRAARYAAEDQKQIGAS